MSRPLWEAYPQAKAFTRPGGDTAVLLLHGFTANPSQLRGIGDRLAEMGCTVRAPLLPGHGTDIDDMLKTGWQDWLSAARGEALALLRGHRKVIVLGFSLGGLLALLLGEELPLDGVIAVAPALLVKHKLAAPAAFLAPLLPKVLGKPRPVDPENVTYGVLPPRKLRDLLTLGRMARLGLPRLHAPLLVIQGQKDELVDPAGANILLEEAVHCFDQELLSLPDAPHHCLGADLPRCAAKIEAFVRRVEEMDAME